MSREKLLVRVAQACIFFNGLDPAHNLWSAFRYFADIPNFWSLYSRDLIAVATVIVMLLLLRFSRTAVATMCFMFSFAGFHDPLLYEWADYMAYEVTWASAFLVAGMALLASIFISHRKKNTGES